MLFRSESANAHALFARFLTVSLTPSERCAALVGLAKSEPNTSSQLLWEAFGASDHEVKGLAVRLLAENPSAETTQKLLSALPLGDTTLHIALIQALASRQGAGVLDALMTASLSQENTLRAVALRALLQRSDVSDAMRLQICHRALPVAQSDSERLLLLSSMQNLANPASLPYLFDNLVHKGEIGRAHV